MRWLLLVQTRAANQFNQQIRLRIKYMEDEIASTDKLMVVKNNYSWLQKIQGRVYCQWRHD